MASAVVYSRSLLVAFARAPWLWYTLAALISGHYNDLCLRAPVRLLIGIETEIQLSDNTTNGGLAADQVVSERLRQSERECSERSAVMLVIARDFPRLPLFGDSFSFNHPLEFCRTFPVP